MTTEQKIIRTEAGVLDSAKQLGNVRQAYQVMGLPPGQLLPVQGAVLARADEKALKEISRAEAQSEESDLAGAGDPAGGDRDRPLRVEHTRTEGERADCQIKFRFVSLSLPALCTPHPGRHPAPHPAPGTKHGTLHPAPSTAPGTRHLLYAVMIAVTVVR
jgi:hypothetical protein